MEGLFVNPDGQTVTAQLFLIVVYGYILYHAACFIGAGSELLLLLYGPGLIGGLLIPIMGAIPDGMIILISGLGPIADVKEQIDVGVGTLAGSTIMLLTVPWALGIYLGRRDIDPATGEAAWNTLKSGKKTPKYTKFTWSKTGVTTFDGLPTVAKTMMGTVLLYLVIQVPAFFFARDPNAVKEEHNYALAGFILTILTFFGYCYYQVVDASRSEIIEQAQKHAAREQWKRSLHKHFPAAQSIRHVYEQFDANHDGGLDRAEFAQALKGLGLAEDRKGVQEIFNMIDVGSNGLGKGDGRIDYDEFERFVSNCVGVSSRYLAPAKGGSKLDIDKHAKSSEKSPLLQLQDEEKSPKPEDDDDEDEEEEEDEEHHELTDTQIKLQALGLLLGGTVLVTVFSDPMVNTISAFAKTINVSAFYISFIVTPMASNASEVISGLIFAAKKTNKGISLTFGALYGAACMNNTFGLGIFMGLIYFRKLSWDYTTETLAIMLTTFAIGILGLTKTVPMWKAAIALALYPLSLVFVAILESFHVK